MNKQTFLEYNEIGWDYAIEQLARNNQDKRIRDLIDIYYNLCEALEIKREPNFGPDRAGDIKHSNADISKARKLLGYDPDYSFEKGIRLAIAWYKENLCEK